MSTRTRLIVGPDDDLPASVRTQSDAVTYGPIMRFWFNRKLGRMRYVDWSIMERCGWRRSLDRILDFQVEGSSHTAWKNLFSIDEIVYLDAYVEFMATYSFNTKTTSYRHQKSIRFRYKDTWHKLSLAKFAVYTGLYTSEQTKTSLFKEGRTTLTTEISPSAIWDLYSTAGPHGLSTKSTAFDDPVHQILHRLITCSVHGKGQNGGAVSQTDLRLMYSILSRENFQVAYYVANALLNEKNSKATAYPFLGALVIRLLRGMGLLEDEDLREYHWEERSLPMDYDMMCRMELITIDQERRLWILSRDHIPGHETVEARGPIIPSHLYQPDPRRQERAQELLQRREQERQQRRAARQARRNEPRDEPAGHPGAGPSTQHTAPQYETHTFWRGDFPDSEYWYRTAQHHENAHYFYEHAAADRGYGALPYPTLPMRAREREHPVESTPFTFPIPTAATDFRQPSTFPPQHHTAGPSYTPSSSIMQSLGHHDFGTSSTAQYSADPPLTLAESIFGRSMGTHMPDAEPSTHRGPEQVLSLAHQTEGLSISSAGTSWLDALTIDGSDPYALTTRGTSTMEREFGGLIYRSDDAAADDDDGDDADEGTSTLTTPRQKRTRAIYSEPRQTYPHSESE